MLKQITRLRVIGNTCRVRQFSSSSIQWEESKRNIRSFPWLLHNDPPRVEQYPYAHASGPFSLLNILPTFIQHASSVRLASRTLYLNTGFSYFPEQFLLGATMATRRALEVLSQHLTDPSNETRRDELEQMMNPMLLARLEQGAKKALGLHDEILLSVPQIYDANLGDVWLTLGNSRAFVTPREYDIFEWMTIQVGMKKVNDSDEESFGDARMRVARGLLEGAHVRVDVKVDADVVYKVNRGDDILMYDEGRRTLLVQFETPYFEPADKMVSSRDENGEPINDWSWRISDIDQLLTKEKLDGITDSDQE
ncbi:hypothetical protein K492DRAFT_239749 [Lichtheimia hyalospora FSU 10163]|nr:hypothetical protein K492DRAFT_239749 [Lichtheimia hyalospora FSU 10163]